MTATNYLCLGSKERDRAVLEFFFCTNRFYWVWQQLSKNSIITPPSLATDLTHQTLCIQMIHNGPLQTHFKTEKYSLFSVIHKKSSVNSFRILKTLHTYILYFNYITRCFQLHRKVHSLCLCAGGFKFPYRTCVSRRLDYDLLPNQLWCHKLPLDKVKI